MSILKYDRPIPRLTTEQMIEVDRLMIERYEIELIQMMENAGRALALVAKEVCLENKLKGKKIVILAGSGGNGGGALVGVRRLNNWGADVTVFLTKSINKMTPVAAHQLKILSRMDVPLYAGEALANHDETFDLIIDGIIGYSLKGKPRETAATMIEWANRQKTPVLSLDTPSGIDLTTGTVFDPAIQAKATLTLALPKKGLFAKEVKKIRGDLYLADISVPPALYKQDSLNLRVGNIFAESDILWID